MLNAFILQNCKELSLRNNKLNFASIKGKGFKQLGKLKLLDLSGNQFLSIRPQLFQGTKSV